MASRSRSPVPAATTADGEDQAVAQVDDLDTSKSRCCPFCLIANQPTHSCCSQFDVSLVNGIRKAGGFASDHPWGICALCGVFCTMAPQGVFCWDYFCWKKHVYEQIRSNQAALEELYKAALHPSEMHRVPAKPSMSQGSPADMVYLQRSPSGTTTA